MIFKKLDRKMKVCIFALIIGVLVIHFLFIYLSGSTILKKDFSQKSSLFGRQIVKYIELRMDAVEETAYLFSNKYDLSSSLYVYNSNLTKDLQELSILNSDILGSFICSENYSYFSGSHYQYAFLNFLHGVNLSDILDGANGRWLQIKEDPNSSSELLLYIQKIQVKQNEVPGFLVLNISPKSFSTLLEGNSNTFLKSTMVLIDFGIFNPLVLNLNESFADVDLNSKRLSDTSDNYYLIKNKFAVTNIPLANKHITIRTITSLKHIETILTILKVTLFALLLLFSFLTYICLFAYMRLLTNALERLYHKLQDFSRTAKNGNA